jgi:translation initiation factor IF-1
MKRLPILAVVAAALLASSVALAASTKTYQVTGTVVDVMPDMIVVMKGSDRWEVIRDASTKMPDNIKKGDKVMITYRMRAEAVEAKPAAKSKTK